MKFYQMTLTEAHPDHDILYVQKKQVFHTTVSMNSPTGVIQQLRHAHLKSHEMRMTLPSMSDEM